MRKLIVGNWKENPRTEAAALKLFRDIKKSTSAEIVICPPFLFLGKIASEFRKRSTPAKKNFAIGAQDIFWEEHGAFTSEVGPKMLRSLGARFVIIGHSERRKYLGETDAMINKKIKVAIADRLQVILCVGEPIEIRKNGIAAAERYIKNQLKKDLAGVNKKLTIAYEPIWAIGSGKNDQTEDAIAMARFIKKELKAMGISSARFLYGGSVNSKNINNYVQYREIDGALVGGASLKAGEFNKIINKTNG